MMTSPRKLDILQIEKIGRFISRPLSVRVSKIRKPSTRSDILSLSLEFLQVAAEPNT